CLERHGWNGLAAYKAAGVTAFAGALFLLVRRRPAVGAAIVTLGCLILLSVTTYSHNLLVQSQREKVELRRISAPVSSDTGRSPHPGVGLPEDCWLLVW